jgi:hypothetical protein
LAQLFERFRCRRGFSVYLDQKNDHRRNQHPFKGMYTGMTTLIVLIRQLDQSIASLDGIAAAICPYLGSFGEQARIDSTERLQKLQNGLHIAGATALHVNLAGTAKADFSKLMAKLERFLQQTAKDAEVEARFELYNVVLDDSAKSPETNGLKK